VISDIISQHEWLAVVTMRLWNYHCSFQRLAIKLLLHASERYILHSEHNCTLGVKLTIHALTQATHSCFGKNILHYYLCLLCKQLTSRSYSIYVSYSKWEPLCALPKCHSVLSSKLHVGDTWCFNIMSNSCHRFLYSRKTVFHTP